MDGEENPYRSPQTPDVHLWAGWQPVAEVACYVLTVVVGSIAPALLVFRVVTLVDMPILLACLLGLWSAGRFLALEKPVWFAVSVLSTAFAALFMFL